MILEINPDTPEPRKIRRAVDALEAGDIIGYPTDTVYGLGCDLMNKKALDRLYQMKGMPRSRPLAFVCRDLAEVARFAVMHNHVFRTLRAHLPGPYTFIVEATREVPRVVQTPRKTVGIRVPKHPVTQALIAELGRPILTTTACRPGEEPFVDPRDIDDAFPSLALVIDAGNSGILPSTIVDLTEEQPKIIREGAGDVRPFQ
ncbi:MAG: L-threonylcarbamoyladenylate synthase [Polyangiaceae bacterium]|jgi:tRNA threonylcarbamoyl adenosine modification protein (Sua5/YciO/YrdC/YwlC family)